MNIICQMVTGYILIKLVPGLEGEALPQIRATHGVLEVNLVFGQWDAIAVVEAKSIFEMTGVIIRDVRGIQGIQDTTTLVGAEL